MKNNKKRILTKKWRNAILQFFMLFLAVFLGFFAENLRENSSDSNKEKEYIKSMIEDVQKDKKNIEETIHNNKVRKTYLDSLSKLSFEYNQNNNKDAELYKYYPIILMRPDFLHPTELTLQQLKNAGGMRLIKNKTAINEILIYDLKEKKLATQQKYYENYQNNSINLGMKIFNHQNLEIMNVAFKTNGKMSFNDLDIKLAKNDKLSMTEFGNTIDMYGGIVDYYIMLLEEMSAQADTLTIKLNKEYKIK